MKDLPETQPAKPSRHIKLIGWGAMGLLLSLCVFLFFGMALTPPGNSFMGIKTMHVCMGITRPPNFDIEIRWQTGITSPIRMPMHAHLCGNIPWYQHQDAGGIIYHP